MPTRRFGMPNPQRNAPRRAAKLAQYLCAIMGIESTAQRVEARRCYSARLLGFLSERSMTMAYKRDR